MNEEHPERDEKGEDPAGGEAGGVRSALDPSQWVDRHGDVLFHYALLRVKDPHVAEDLVQETFLAALRSRGSFRKGSTVRTWLVGILKHKIVDHFRKSARRSTESELTREDDEEAGRFGRMGIWSKGHRPTAWEESPSAILENREFYRAFLACLDRLTPALRQVFSMREVDGMESREICKVMDITATNLWVMLYRSRIKLRECLEDTWFREQGS